MLSADQFATANISPRSSELPMSPPEVAGTPRTQRWGRWLTRTLDERGMTPADFRKALTALAGPGRYNSGTISSWRSGDKAPSEGACLFIARALLLPVPEVLRAAGFEEIATILEAEPPREDPRLSRIRNADLNPAQASALEEYYRERVADLDALIETRIARIMGSGEADERGEDEGGNEDAS